MAQVIGKDSTVAESIDKDLEVLQPEEQFIEVFDEKIYVREFVFGNMLKALKHINNMISSVDENISIERNMLSIIAEHEEDVLGILSLSTGYPKEYLQTIPSDKGVDLAILTYKVNESFFVQNIAPKINALFPSDSPETTEQEPPKSKSKKAGSTSSKN